MSKCDGRASQLWTNHSKELWGNHTRWAGTLVFRSASDGRCLMVPVTSYTMGPGLTMADCDQVRPGYGPSLAKAMTWSVVSAEHGSALRSEYSACCGDIFATRPVCLAVDRFPTCGTVGALGAWCDSTLDASDRAQALVKRMSLDEKAANMDSHNFGVPSLGVRRSTRARRSTRGAMFSLLRRGLLTRTAAADMSSRCPRPLACSAGAAQHLLRGAPRLCWWVRPAGAVRRLHVHGLPHLLPTSHLDGCVVEPHALGGRRHRSLGRGARPLLAGQHARLGGGALPVGAQRQPVPRSALGPRPGSAVRGATRVRRVWRGLHCRAPG
eukprot:6165411-Prymnesium_polylepis.1